MGSVRLWTWSATGLSRREGGWPSLDRQSLDLPEGVYTTMRTYGGRLIPGLSRHLQRLADSVRLLGSEHSLDLAWVRRGIQEVLHAAALPEVRLRLTVPMSCREVFLGVEPFTPFPAELYDRGARCRTSALARRSPEAKSTAFIPRASRARSEAGPGIHELLLLDAAGHILEGSSSNFFTVLDGELRTAGEGVLAGVTRTLILELARDLLPVREEAVALGDLERASEAFLSSSSREVMPVVQVDETPIGAGIPGTVTIELARRYRVHLEDTAEAP